MARVVAEMEEEYGQVVVQLQEMDFRRPAVIRD